MWGRLFLKIPANQISSICIINESTAIMLNMLDRDLSWASHIVLSPPDPCTSTRAGSVEDGLPRDWKKNCVELSVMFGISVGKFVYNEMSCLA